MDMDFRAPCSATYESTNKAHKEVQDMEMIFQFRPFLDKSFWNFGERNLDPGIKHLLEIGKHLLVNMKSRAFFCTACCIASAWARSQDCMVNVTTLSHDAAPPHDRNRRQDQKSCKRAGVGGLRFTCTTITRSNLDNYAIYTRRKGRNP